MINFWRFKDDRTIDSFFIAPEQEAHFIFKEGKDRNDNFNLRNIQNVDQMKLLYDQIQKNEAVKARYLKLTFLQTIDLAVGTSETIPIDLFTRVY